MSSIFLPELIPNRQLINSDFVNYNLSRNQSFAPSISKILPTGVCHLLRNDKDFSYLHVRLYTLFNYLTTDPWLDSDVYYTDKDWKIIKYAYLDGKESAPLEVVWNIPKNLNSKFSDYPVSIGFANEVYALVADGTGLLYVVNTGDRSQSEKWKVEFSTGVTITPSILCDARCEHSKSEVVKLHCLTLTIEIQDERRYHALYWTLIVRDEKGHWNVGYHKEVRTKGAIYYAYIEKNCERIFISTDRSIETVPNTTKKPKEYYWQQRMDYVDIWFPVSEHCTMENIEIDIKETYIRVKTEDQLRLSGELYGKIDLDSITSKIENRRLKVSLRKSEQESMWKYLTEGEDQSEGEDSQLTNLIHEKHGELYTEEKLNDKFVVSKDSLFNLSQLDDCDMAPNETTMIVAINNEDKVTHEAVICDTWLFNIRKSPNEHPYFCIRQGDHGNIWKLMNISDTNWCEHVECLSALGYVHASKSAKYTTCSKDFEYFVICREKCNILVYKQLRKTPKEMDNQETEIHWKEEGICGNISIFNNKEILGIHISAENVLYVLNNDELHVIQLNTL